MSVVSGVILTYSVAEVQTRGDGFPKRHLGAWLDQANFPPLIAVDGATASWHPGCEILIGGYNHFDEAGFASFVQSLPWSFPENVVLIIEPDEGPTQVIRPKAE
jgi:hypothetical protein